MTYFLTFLSFYLISNGQDAPEVGFTESVTTQNDSNVTGEDASPFYSCSMRKTSTGQRQTSWINSSVPETDRNGNKTADFFRELQKRIEDKVKESAELSLKIKTCFKPPYAETAEAHCSELRSWLNPEKYPSLQPPEKEDTLTYNIKKARAHLALANPQPSVRKIMKANSNLMPYGYKTVDWNPLSPAEENNAQNVLQKYKEQFKKNNSLSEDQFNSLLEPYNRSAEHQIYANPMNTSSEELKHLVMQSELERSFAKVRTQHLEEYRAIVAQYPIINYLSSSNPSLQEMQTAGLRMHENAKKELDSIKSIGQMLNNPTQRVNPRQPDTTINNSYILNIMDYRSLTEELLAEHPEYCAVATTAELQREKRELHRSILIAAPVLAVCFFAPPVSALIGSAAASASMAYSSYQTLNDQRQAAYMTPINDGSLRANQFSVDEAQKTFNSDLVMMPIDILMGGALSVSGKRILRLRRSEN